MIASWWVRWKARRHALTVLEDERYAVAQTPAVRAFEAKERQDTEAAEHRCEWRCAPLVNGECPDCKESDTPMFPKGGCDSGHN